MTCFTQLVYGIRTSLLIAAGRDDPVHASPASWSASSAGYMGGKTDYFLGRLIDLMLSFPQQLFFVAFMPVVDRALRQPAGGDARPGCGSSALIIVLWLLGWMALARLLRGQVLSPARAGVRRGGQGHRRLALADHPQGAAAQPVDADPGAVDAACCPNFVTAEAGLSFLGVGMVEPTPDWGRMFPRGAEVYQSDITYMIFPGVAMVIFVVAFNLLGDSVRDAFDPKTRR